MSGGWACGARGAGCWRRRASRSGSASRIEYRWRDLLRGVDPRSGRRQWQWLPRFRQAQLKPVLAAWKPDAIVWDGAGAHRGKHRRDLPTQRVFLPSSSPELNPAARVFAEIRRRVEGRVYSDLDAKQAVVETFLQDLASDPARVKRLCGWDWILDAVAHLPPPTTPAADYPPCL